MVSMVATKIKNLLVFSAGATFGVVAMALFQSWARQTRKRSCEQDKQAVSLRSLPHGIDRDVDELAKSVRSGILSGAEATLVLLTHRIHNNGALQRIDGPGNREGLHKKLRTSPHSAWASARRLIWGACRLLRLDNLRATGCKFVAFESGEVRCLESPPPQPALTTRFVVVSDTHLRHRDLPQLPKCDVLVHCGDVMLCGGEAQPYAGTIGEAERSALVADFDAWLGMADADMVLMVGGNHDGILEHVGAEGVAKLIPSARFLSGEGVRVRGGLYVWGCCYSNGHGGSNDAWQPFGKARKEVLRSIPSGVDVLLTHGPPLLPRGPFGKKGTNSFGCPDLLEAVTRVEPALHLFGHDHSAKGALRPSGGRTLYVCATSVVGGTLTVENAPIVIDVPFNNQQQLPS